MKYTIVIHSDKIQSLIDKGCDVKVTKQNESSYCYIEVTIKSDADLLRLIHAGEDIGFKAIKQQSI